MTRVLLITLLLVVPVLSQEGNPWKRFPRAEGESPGKVRSVALSHDRANLFILLDLEGSPLPTAAIYFDTDLDDDNGSTYVGAFGPKVSGWERKLVYGEPFYKPERPGYVILPDGGYIFRTEKEGTISFFDGDDGWVTRTKGDLVLSVPLKALGKPKSFDFILVDRREAGYDDVIRGRYQVTAGKQGATSKPLANLKKGA